MKGYKAFNPGLICRGKQYAENTVFEEDEAVICAKGMHFCKYPLDVLDYYPLIGDDMQFADFAEVEAMDDAKSDDGKKFCTKRLKIGAKVDIHKLASFQIDVLKEEMKKVPEKEKQVGGDWAQQVGGNWAKQVGGDWAQQVGGNWAQQVGGDWAKQVGGNSAQQVGGNSAQQVGGDWAKQVGGNSAKQVGGNSAQQVGGNWAQQVGGDNSVMVAGPNSKFKAGLHSVYVTYNYDKDGNIKAPAVAFIDGIKFKPDTWYSYENGEFVEVQA